MAIPCPVLGDAFLTSDPASWESTEALLRKAMMTYWEIGVNFDGYFSVPCGAELFFFDGVL